MSPEQNPYELSTDYARLHELLKQGFIVLGFCYKVPEQPFIVQIYIFEGLYIFGIRYVADDLLPTVQDFSDYCTSENISFIDVWHTAENTPPKPFEVGDEVFNRDLGRGTVVEFKNDIAPINHYPIYVKFESGSSDAYTVEGFESRMRQIRTLFHTFENPKIVTQ